MKKFTLLAIGLLTLALLAACSPEDVETNGVTPSGVTTKGVTPSGVKTQGVIVGD